MAWRRRKRNLKEKSAQDARPFLASRLGVETLEARLTLSVNVFESFPTFYGELSEAGAALGSSASMDGEWAVVGAPADYQENLRTGAAYVYRSVDGQWQPFTKLVAAGGAAFDGFGTAVAIDGETIVVGAPGDDQIAPESGASYVYRLQADSWILEEKITASVAPNDLQFGAAVDIEDDTIVVGAAHGYSWSIVTPKSAYVFERSGTDWTQTATLRGTSHPGTDKGYGASVAIADGLIVVGAKEEYVVINWEQVDYRYDAGAAYVYRRNAEEWSMAARLTAPAPTNSERFGSAVATDGASIVIGAPGCDLGVDLSFAGAAYVYSLHEAGWEVDSQLTAGEDAARGGYFGVAVAIDGDRLLVGGSYQSGRAGTAYLFQQSSVGQWAELNELSTLEGQIGSGFGSSVAMDGQNILVGERNYLQHGVQIGAVHPFVISDASSEISLLGMSHPRSDTVRIDYAVQGNAPDVTLRVYRSADEAFDFSDLSYFVHNATLEATSGFGAHSFVPTAYDPARPFLIAVANSSLNEGRTNDNRATMRQIAPVYAIETFPAITSGKSFENYQAYFGESMSFDGDLGVIGAVGDDLAIGTRSGAAYIAEKIEDAWHRTAVLLPHDPNYGDRFGLSSDIEGRTVVVGAPGNDERSQEAGAVYVFQYVNGAWREQAKLMATDGQASYLLGSLVAIDGDVIYATARSNLNYNSNFESAGLVFAFQRNGDGWIQIARLQEPGVVNEYGGFGSFGVSIDADGGRLVVGANRNKDALGAAYVYAHQGNALQLSQTLTTMEIFEPQQYATIRAFGSILDLTDGRLAIGARQGFNPYAFVYNLANGQFELEVELTDPAGGSEQNYYSSIAIEGDFIALGDYLDDDQGRDLGAIYLFQRMSPGTWVEHPKIYSFSAEAYSHFGFLIDLDQGDLLVSNQTLVEGRPVGAIRRFSMSSVPSDVVMISAEQLAPREVRVEYAVQRVGGPLTINTYRSADRTLDAGDLAYLAAHSTTVADVGYGVYTFDPGVRDSQRPFLITVLTSSAAESSLDNNQSVIEQEVPLYAIEQFPAMLADYDQSRRGEFAGHAVAMDADLAVVGAPYHGVDANQETGAAYVWRKVNGDWTLEALLTPPVSDLHSFGYSVAVDGNTIVVGAPGKDSGVGGVGAAFVFELLNGRWTLTQSLRSSQPRHRDGFGCNVGVDGDVVVVAARSLDNSYDREAIHVFERTASGWQEAAAFVAPYVYPESGYGLSLDVAGDTIVVSGPLNVSVGSTYGAVYVYSRVDGAWQQTAKLSSPNPDAPSPFGEFVSLDGNRLAVIANRQSPYQPTDREIYCYFYELENGVWTYQDWITIDGSRSGPIALHGDVLIISAHFETPGTYGAYLFGRTDSAGWLRHATINPGDKQLYGDFSVAVATNGHDFFIGAPNADRVTYDSGAVFAYEIGDVSVDVDLVGMKQPFLDQMTIEYSLTGLAGPATVVVYRSIDEILDETDLLYQAASQTVGPANGRGMFAFNPGPRDLDRPYLIAVAIASQPEHSLLNNVLTWRQRPDLGVDLVEEGPRVAPPGGETNSGYGASLDVDNDVAVIGNAKPSHAGTGSAQILRRVNNAWVQEALLLPTGPSEPSYGQRVAISDNRIIIGAPQDDQAGVDAGAIYVYAYNGSQWVQEAKLLGRYAGDAFGSSVDIENDVIVVGAYRYSYSRGAAYVFERQLGNWNQTGDLVDIPNFWSSDFQIGHSVAIADERIAVGASGASAVVMMKRSVAGWVTDGVLLGPGSSDDAFGETLAMDAGVLVVGASQESGLTNVARSGAVYVYELENDAWSLTQRLTAKSSTQYGLFGASLDVHDGVILITARDSVRQGFTSNSLYVFTQRSGGYWQGETRATGEALQNQGYFEGAIAASGDTVIVGGFSGVVTTNGAYQYFANRVQAVYTFDLLRPSQPTPAGDYDRDGLVNGADFLRWQREFGKTTEPFEASDGDGSGAVDAVDLDAWASRFGAESLSQVAGDLDAVTNSSVDAAAFAADSSDDIFGALPGTERAVASSGELQQLPVDSYFDQENVRILPLDDHFTEHSFRASPRQSKQEVAIDAVLTRFDAGDDPWRGYEYTRPDIERFGDAAETSASARHFVVDDLQSNGDHSTALRRRLLGSHIKARFRAITS